MSAGSTQCKDALVIDGSSLARLLLLELVCTLHEQQQRRLNNTSQYGVAQALGLSTQVNCLTSGDHVRSRAREEATYDAMSSP
jgi:hypothetical protein